MPCWPPPPVPCRGDCPCRDRRPPLVVAATGLPPGSCHRHRLLLPPRVLPPPVAAAGPGPGAVRSRRRPDRVAVPVDGRRASSGRDRVVLERRVWEPGAATRDEAAGRRAHRECGRGPASIPIDAGMIGGRQSQAVPPRRCGGQDGEIVTRVSAIVMDVRDPDRGRFKLDIGVTQMSKIGYCDAGHNCRSVEAKDARSTEKGDHVPTLAVVFAASLGSPASSAPSVWRSPASQPRRVPVLVIFRRTRTPPP